LARPEKEQAIAELKEHLQNSELAIATKYVGVSVAKVTELRRKLREQGVTYKVYKNTLAKRALDEMGLSDAAEFMDGPTAWAFSQDPVSGPKVLKEFAKDVNVIAMNGGILSGKIVTTAQLEALAALPPREVLLQQVVGTIAAPLRDLVGTLSALPRNLVNALDQVRKQKEEGQAA
jgi:large subunit ribosomal protein L10